MNWDVTERGVRRGTLEHEDVDVAIGAGAELLKGSLVANVSQLLRPRSRVRKNVEAGVMYGR